MTVWIKLALRELTNNRKFSLFFILNLTLGLIGFIALDSFKLSIETHINHRSKSILSADLDVYSIRPLPIDDLVLIESELGEKFKKTTQINFLSMVASNSSSRLVQVVAIGDGYPLYGEIILDNQQAITSNNVPLIINQKPYLWIQPELLITLGLKIGDNLKIGKKEFKIVDKLIESPGISFWSAGIAYRVFIGMDQAEETGLIKLGSRRYHHYLYKIPNSLDVKKVAKSIEQKFRNKYGSNPPVTVQTHQGSSKQINRSMSYLSDYLGLVSLVALFLAGIGTAYLFRGYLSNQFKEIAILMSLGGTKTGTYFLSLIQISVLGIISALLASLLAIIIIPIFPMLLGDFLPKGFVGYLNTRSIVLAILIGVFGSILFCLPVLVRIRKVKPILLLNDNLLDQKVLKGQNFIDLLSYLPITIIYWFLSIWQAQSIKIGSIFTGSLIFSFIILGITGWFLLGLSARLFKSSGLNLRLVARNLNRNRFAVLSSFVAIGIGTLLINLIPQIHQGLDKEISAGDQDKIPIFFLFDIQTEQTSELRDFLEQKGVKIGNISAMIQARLQKINGKTYKRENDKNSVTREEQQEENTKSRIFNLSFRSKLTSAESIIEGRPFLGRYQEGQNQLPEISLTKRFGEKIGVKINETITFDVQGVPIQGKIVNFRKVKWNSFQPNFYILFQPGVLEYAPGTFLATIMNIGSFSRVELQNEVVREFPNISIIDVSMLIKKALEITNQINWALQVMAILAVIAGLIVVYSISRYNAQSRSLEVNLLKVLGARFSDIRLMILFEFGILGLIASFIGAWLSILVSYVMAYIIFNSVWGVDWVTAGLSVIAITFLSMVTAYLGARKVLRQKPLALLKAL